MSRVWNKIYFDIIDQIETEAEDYNRNYSRTLLVENGCSEFEAEKILNDLEESWDARVDYLVEQERENAET